MTKIFLSPRTKLTFNYHILQLVNNEPEDRGDGGDDAFQEEEENADEEAEEEDAVEPNNGEAHPRRRESSLMREAGINPDEEDPDFDEQQDVDMSGDLHGKEN